MAGISGIGGVGDLKALQGISNTLRTAAGTSAAQPQGPNFAEMLGNLIEVANSQQMAADSAIAGLASGTVRDVHEAIIAAEKARLSVEVLAQMRNKLVDAYHEIMRMQI